jgi:hypothetical protein
MAISWLKPMTLNIAIQILLDPTSSNDQHFEEIQKSGQHHF